MSVEVTVSWDDALPSKIDAAIAKSINVSAMYLQGKMKEVFNESAGGGYKLSNVIGTQSFKYRKDKEYGNFLGRSRYGKVGEVTRKRFKSQRLRYASSEVGESPGVRSGRLRNSIGIVTATASTPFAFVGTNLAYGRWLEYGWINKARDGSTSHIAARPWCLRALDEQREKCLEKMRESFSASLKSIKGAAQ